MKKTAGENWKKARINKEDRRVRFAENVRLMKGRDDNEKEKQKPQQLNNYTDQVKITPKRSTNEHKEQDNNKNKTAIDSVYVDNRCRYWIQQRIGEMMNANSFTSKSGYAFAVDTDRYSGGLCFRFSRNGTEVARIDSNGYLYCSNAWLNGVNILNALNSLRDQVGDIGGDLSQYVKHKQLKNGTYELNVKEIITRFLKVLSSLLAAGQSMDGLVFGKDYTTNGNNGHVRFTYAGDDNVNNSISLGFNGYTDQYLFYRDRCRFLVPFVSDGGADGYLPAIICQNTAQSNYGSVAYFMCPNMKANNGAVVHVGKEDTKGNDAQIRYQWAGNNNVNNYLSIGFYGYDNIYKFYRDRCDFTLAPFTSTNKSTPAITCQNTGHEANTAIANFLCPNLANNEGVVIKLGRTSTKGNTAQIRYQYAGSDSANSYLGFDFHSYNNIYKFYRDRCDFSLVPFVSNAKLTPAITCQNTDDNISTIIANLLSPNLSANNGTIIRLGRTDTHGNSGQLRYQWAGNDNVNSFMSLEFLGYDYLYKFYRDRAVFSAPLTLEYDANSMFMIKSKQTPAIIMGYEYAQNESMVIRYKHDVTPHYTGIGFYSNDDIVKIDTDKNVHINGSLKLDNSTISQICTSSDYGNYQKINDNALITSQAVNNAINNIPTPEDYFDKVDDGEFTYSLPEGGYYSYALYSATRDKFMIFRNDVAIMYVSDDGVNNWTAEDLPDEVDNENIACLSIDDTLYYYNGSRLYKNTQAAGWQSVGQSITLYFPTLCALNDFIILAGGLSNTNTSVYRYNRSDNSLTFITFERGARRFCASGSDRVVTMEPNQNTAQQTIRWSFNGIKWFSSSINHVQSTSCLAYGSSGGVGCWVAGTHDGGGKCTCIWWDSPYATNPSYQSFDKPADGEVVSVVFNAGVWIMYIDGDPNYYYNRSPIPCFGTWEHAAADNSHTDTQVFWCKDKFILLSPTLFTDEYNITNIDPIYQLNTTAAITASNLSADNETRLARLEAQMKNIMNATLQNVYPVGAIYFSMSSLSPDLLFGFGTWVMIPNKFLYCVNDQPAGVEGGEATHTLTANEMPAHNHGVSWSVYNSSAGTAGQFGNYPIALAQDKAANWDRVSGTSIQNAGSGQAHNNMPPYLTVFAWQRTA